jgi:hypothetical protein
VPIPATWPRNLADVPSGPRIAAWVGHPLDALSLFFGPRMTLEVLVHFSAEAFFCIAARGGMQVLIAGHVFRVQLHPFRPTGTHPGGTGDPPGRLPVRLRSRLLPEDGRLSLSRTSLRKRLGSAGYNPYRPGWPPTPLVAALAPRPAGGLAEAAGGGPVVAQLFPSPGPRIRETTEPSRPNPHESNGFPASRPARYSRDLYRT